MRVPSEADKGKAKVKVSFPAWEEGKVAPATFELSVVDEEPRPKEITPKNEPHTQQHHQPDWLPLGTVCTGAMVEASFAVFARSDDAKKVWVWVKAPPFVKVLDKSTLDREYREGDEQIKAVAAVVTIGIDTSKPGALQGQIEVDVDPEADKAPVTVKIPVAVVVKRPEQSAVRMLVVDSPFHWTSTGDPAVFKDWTDLAADAGWNVSYRIVREKRPVFPDLDLSKFDVVLLDAGGLVWATAEDVKRVRAFAEGGGRLVVTTSRFFSGSVEMANKVLDGYGLKMLNEEAPIGPQRFIPAVDLDKESFAPEVIRAGIKSARFHRASPTVISPDKPARVLVKAVDVGGPKDGYVATAKAGKGDVVVLGQSLWWSWICEDQARGTDNAKLLRLLLTPTTEKLREKD